MWSVSLHAHSCEFGLCLSSMSQAFPAMKDGKWPRVFPYITVSLVCVSHTQSGGIGLCGLCLCMHTAVSLVSLIHEPSISCITGCEGNGTITGVISGTFEWNNHWCDLRRALQWEQLCTICLTLIPPQACLNGTITGVISGTFEWKQLCKIDTVPSSGTPSKGSNGARFASLLSLLSTPSKGSNDARFALLLSLLRRALEREQ